MSLHVKCQGFKFFPLSPMCMHEIADLEYGSRFKIPNLLLWAHYAVTL